MMRRFARDESGMTLVLAMVMILLIGVMGAGLLTFAGKDLDTVLEANRGQRAFELADAGVGVAKRQITADCVGDASCTGSYDASMTEDFAPEDIQWSWRKGGVTLSDLDDNVTTVDSVHVAIDYQAGINRNRFKITSTGTYGESRRKIEATIGAQNGSVGGEGIGHPLYYTPSNITIEGNPDNYMQVTGISMFTKGDIVMKGLPEGLDDSGCVRDPINPLKNDYENENCGIFQIRGTGDRGLGNWYSPGFAQNIRGDWNLVRRLGYGDPPRPGRPPRPRPPFDGPGFAAEGRICAVGLNDPIDGECRDSSGNPLPSIADGVYGYDSTTGAIDLNGDQPGTDSYAFAEKINCSTGIPEPTRNVNGTNGTTCTTPAYNIISYPFPLLQPREKRLALIAQEQEDEGGGGDYYKASPVTGCSPPWEDMLADATENSVYFIDLGDCVNFDGSPMQIPMEWQAAKDGIIVAWCGNLNHTNDTKFTGILMNLTGDGLNADGSSWASNCGEDPTDADGDLDSDEDDPRFGVYRLEDRSEMFGWLYAEGGTPQRAGIELAASESNKATDLHFNPGATPNFLDDILSTDTPPTGFVIRSWRECYERDEDPIENARVC